VKKNSHEVTKKENNRIKVKNVKVIKRNKEETKYEQKVDR
jgi:hypothetical protein